MSSLTDPGISKYGGYTFPVETETTGISVVPQYDQAGRTVIHNTYTLTLQSYLTGRATDASVRAIVQQLTKPAYPFIYAGRGLGVAVNVGGVRDVVWGPKPQSCEIKPLGGGNGVLLTWRVSFCIPDCSDATYAFAAMEYNYTLQWSIDEGGYTRRVYSGFIRVPMTRGRSPQDRVIPDSADVYREQINPPMIPGYRRIPGEFTISQDKCRLDFSIQDVQFQTNVPPPGIIKADADHQLSSTPGKFYEWNGSLNATYELAIGSGATPADARDAFFALLKDRVGWTMYALSLKGGPNLPPNPGAQGGKLDNAGNYAVIPVSFTMSEPSIYGPPVCRYAVTYRVTGASLRDMLLASGLWRPTPDGNWVAWAASMQNTLGPRGHSGLIFNPGDDSIVDLCNGNAVDIDLSNGGNKSPGGFQGIPSDTFPAPTPDASWLDYKCHTYMEVDNNNVPITTLLTKPGKAVNDILGGLALGAIGAVPGREWIPELDFFTPPVKNVPPEDVPGGDVQRRKQKMYLHLTGSAARVAYPIPCPLAASWNGSPLTPCNRLNKGEGFWAGVIGDVGYPVYGARWNLRYFVEEVPTAVLPVPENPLNPFGDPNVPPPPGFG